ncbi:MAG TPA: 2-dehydropantoate 2-reductase [Ideonella sp.]|nr:2-dehydropantoate 2-reductase [Ideonella sp.]
MKICVFGAGAIGGHLAAWMARGGLEVSVVARGAHLAAIQARGLRYFSSSEDFTVPLRASADARELGPQDLVIACVKAHSLPGAVDALQPLLGPETPVVFAINGVPWWYFHGIADQAGPVAAASEVPAAQRLPRLDPQGRLWRELGVERAIGCVVTSPNQITEPGVVHNSLVTNSFVFGEPDGSESPRLARIAAALKPALPGFGTSPRIRDLIWAKLSLNVATSPLACLSFSTVADYLGNPEMMALLRRLMHETRLVASSQGVTVTADPEAAITRVSGSRHPPSMLQDLLAGRPLEIDGQLRAVQDLARLGRVETPALDLVLTLLGQRAQAAALAWA